MPVRVTSQNPADHGSARMRTAVSYLIRMIPAPSHLPNVSLVGKWTLDCLAQAIDLLPVHIPHVYEACEVLSVFGDQNVLVGTPPAMLGIQSEFSAWGWLGTSSFPEDDDTQLTVGKLLVVSLLRGEPIDKTTIKQMKSVHRKLLAGELNENQFEKLLQEIHGRVNKKFLVHVEQAVGSVDSRQLVLNVGVLGTIVSRFSSLRRKERQAAGGDQAFSLHETKTCIHALLQQVEQGQADALVKLVCFCLGLGWDIGKSTPFVVGEEGDGNLAWIDPVAGWMYINLNPVLKDLGKNPDPRHLPTTMVLRRPLPLIVANQLYDAYLDNPTLKAPEGLLESISYSRKKISLQGVHHSASTARLMRSARSVGLTCIKRREIAAFATLGFELISKSDLHYISPREIDIWQGCEALYSTVGLGTMVPFTSQNAGRFGSRLTPSGEWVRDIFQESENHVDRTRCGRRYTLQSTLEFHNAYVRYIGLFIQLIAGGRDRREFEFLASAWNPEHPFALHEDKPLGASRSRTPIPISSLFAEQLRLWMCHLSSLTSRLEKLKALGHKAVEHWVQSIKAGQDVPLLFTLDQCGAPYVLTAVSVFSGQARDLNRDFGRHFIACRLSDSGLFEHAQEWLRHYSTGVSSFEITSIAVTHGSMTQMVRAIDEILTGQGLKPVTGLSKGVVS